MELFEYIKSQLPQMPNSAIMKQLGASQELIDYVKETPENTNFAIAEVIEGSGGGDAEVWFTGSEYEDEDGRRIFTLSNVGSTDHMEELFTNAENYQIVLNGEEMPYMVSTEQDKVWLDNQSVPTKTVQVEFITLGQVYEALAVYMDASTAPTSVEVSVKAK